MKQTSSTKHISDDAPKLKASDLARAKLRVGMQEVSREEFSDIAHEVGLKPIKPR